MDSGDKLGTSMCQKKFDFTVFLIPVIGFLEHLVGDPFKGDVVIDAK